jgi:hypothetical protein
MVTQSQPLYFCISVCWLWDLLCTDILFLAWKTAAMNEINKKYWLSTGRQDELQEDWVLQSEAG